MAKIDYKRQYPELFKPSPKTFSVVDVPPLQYLMIDGQGDPNSAQAYQDALQALYGLAYALKFALKARDRDHVVMPLEGLWWAPDMADFTDQDKSAWHWTMMIMQPPQVDKVSLASAREQVAKKKDSVAMPKVRLETLEEGLAAQILYLGPYADEAPTIQRLHDYIEEQGCERFGKHHEVYLSDPRRTAPERLKTVIRQPMRPRT